MGRRTSGSYGPGTALEEDKDMAIGRAYTPDLTEGSPSDVVYFKGDADDEEGWLRR